MVRFSMVQGHKKPNCTTILSRYIIIIIIIIIIIPYWLLPLKFSLQLVRFSVSSLFSTDISIMEIYL